jgi:hypothetical protein
MATGNDERLICDILQGVPAAWPGGDNPDAVAEFLAAGRYHGVLPLLDAAFRDRADIGTWPNEVPATCRKAALHQAMLELAHRAEIARVLEALASVGAAPLVLKGAALAHTHYPNAALRPRADTDLLISPRFRSEAEHALARLGYTKSEDVQGEHIFTQAAWSRLDHLSVPHHLDVHWRINNSPILAKSLDYDELARRAVPLPPLGHDARSLAPVHALLFACIHRAGHTNAPYYVDGVPHLRGDRLIWLYDIHLLVTSMQADELAEFAALAASREMKAICIAALQRTSECFGTPIPGQVADVLDRPGRVEPSARYLSGGRGRQMLGEFLAFDHWSDRAAWLKELAFPSADYMRSKYPDAGNARLSLLYARRALTGAASLVRRHTSSPSRRPR